MPPRRDYTSEELAVRLDRQREQGRLRAARWRARHRVTVINEGNADAVTRTPPSPPAPPAPSTSRRSYGTPAPTNGRPRGNPKVAAVIDGLRAVNLPAHLTGEDCKALKDTTLEPAQVVEAFAAAFHGRWGDAWLKTNLSVSKVIARYAGYVASRRPVRPATTVEQVPPSVVVLKADMERIPTDEVRRALAEAATVPLAVKLARVKERVR